MATITGTHGNDVLIGTNDPDTITGLGGDDILDGRGGADVMDGGTGSDEFYVDRDEDVVLERQGEGYDRVWASTSYVLTAGSSIERLTTTHHFGTAAINLTGNELAQDIYGNDGNNILNGAGGDDWLYGRSGDDQFYVDGANDLAIERQSEGYDRVWASTSYVLAAGSSIERLTTTNHFGTSSINLTGNELAQDIFGNDGNNALIGGGGDDWLYGRAGDDQFYVDSANDLVIERAGEGNDSVFTTVSYGLRPGEEIERLSAANPSSTSAINLMGNEFNNIITGNLGGNRIDGGLGNDTIGLIPADWDGADVVAFTTRLDAATNVDTIQGFQPAFDKISLLGGGDEPFAALPLGQLQPGAFVTGTAATTAEHRIIYNSASGSILYDPDGTGSQAAIHFANIQPGLTNLSASNFFVENLSSGAWDY